MLRVSQLLIAGLTTIVAPGLQADCAYPEEIDIPDGAASTYEEMRNSQTYIKEYMAEMEAFLECIEQEKNATLENEQLNQSEVQHTQRRHEAIDAMESVAAKFNEQVRAYKKVNP